MSGAPSRSNVHHALRDPRAIVAAPHLERRVGRALDLDRRPVARDVDRLAPRGGLEPMIRDPALAAPEQDTARRHLVDERVQPVGEEQLVVGRRAADRDRDLGRHERRIGHDGRERDRRTLERCVDRRPDAPDADVRAVPEVLPRHRRSASRFQYCGPDRGAA